MNGTTCLIDEIMKVVVGKYFEAIFKKIFVSGRMLDYLEESLLVSNEENELLMQK